MVRVCKDCGLEAALKDKNCQNCGGELIDKSPNNTKSSPSKPIYPLAGNYLVYCTNCKQVVSLKKSPNWYVVLFLILCCCCGLLIYIFYYLAIKEPDTCPICRERLESIHGPLPK